MIEDLRKMLVDSSSYVSTCSLAAIRLMGLESLDWDPLIIRDTMQDILKMPKMPQKLFDKINCGYTMIGTNGYTGSLEIFVPCNAIMSGIPIEEGSLGMDDQYSLAWGVYEYLKLTGDDPKEVTFNVDTAVYAGEILYANGITTPPTWLDWAMIDPEKISRLDEVLEDPQFYMDRQAGMVKDIVNHCKTKEAEMISQLSSLDKLIPARNQ